MMYEDMRLPAGHKGPKEGRHGKLSPYFSNISIGSAMVGRGNLNIKLAWAAIL